MSTAELLPSPVVAQARDACTSAPVEPAYSTRLAATEAERRAACRLRFEVFHLELNEGLASSYATGLDEDEFDTCCDHLLIEERATGEIVGTYRMQPGERAARHRGYYSQTIFDLSPYEILRPQVLELGRACVRSDHRSMPLLSMLWRGIAEYAQKHGLRYLLGCSSLTSQCAAEGWAMYRTLSPWWADAPFQTMPHASHALPAAVPAEKKDPPRLLRAYLAVGAQICSTPALDRAFGTIDFLTLLDLERLTPSARARFFREPSSPVVPRAVDRLDTVAGDAGRPLAPASSQ